MLVSRILEVVSLREKRLGFRIIMAHINLIHPPLTYLSDRKLAPCSLALE
jgi:hypothetical protein